MSQHQKDTQVQAHAPEGADQTLIAIVWKTVVTVVATGIFCKLIGVF